MQNAVYPGRQPSAIPRDRPVILRYRLVLHRGELAPADIERLQKEYAAGAHPLNCSGPQSAVRGPDSTHVQS